MALVFWQKRFVGFLFHPRVNGPIGYFCTLVSGPICGMAMLPATQKDTRGLEWQGARPASVVGQVTGALLNKYK
jgi:hypothetical protein